MNGTATRPPAATTLPASPAPAVPAAAPAPVAAPAVVPKAPAAAPKPAAAPAKPDIGLPKTAIRPTVDPKRALGLPESPGSTMAALVKNARAKLKLDDTPFSSVPAPATHPAAAPAAPVPVIPAPEPAVPAIPAAVAPEPAVPAAAPAAQEPPHPLDTKIQELQQQMEELKRQKTPPAPAPAPAPQETPEQLQARQATWIAQYGEHLPADLTEAQMDTILTGGAPAVQELAKIRKGDMARSVLEARTSIYSEINPVIAEISQGLGVLLKEHLDVQRFNIETQFFTKYPDLAPQRDYTNQVANYLLQTYPQECAKLHPDQFIDYLHGETTKLLDAQAKRVGFASWADATARAAAAPASAAQVPAAPAPSAVAPAAAPGAPRHLSAPGPSIPAAAMRVAAPAPSTPPSPHAPGAVPAGGAPKSWASAVATDLRN